MVIMAEHKEREREVFVIFSIFYILCAVMD